jgi:hypothetical protein
MSTDTPNEVRVKKPFPLRKLAITAVLCTAVGYILIFVPPQYPFSEFFLFLGDVLAFIGLGTLIAAIVVYVRRPQYSQRANKSWSLAYSAVRGGYRVIILGIISLIVSRIVLGVIFPVPSVLNPQTSASLAQSLGNVIIGGIFWGFVIGFYFVTYSNKIPFANPIYRALVVSSLVVLIVIGLETLFHLNDAASYFLLATAYTIPSYLILGIVLGYSYQKFNPEQTIQALQSQPVKRRVKLYYYLVLFVIIGVFFGASFYQNSQIPVSFAASNLQFSNIDGTISLQFMVTNPSGSALIQVNAFLDGMNMGECNPGPLLAALQTNQTATCVIANPYPSQISCSNLPVLTDYGLRLNAYFGNSKTVNNYYTVTRQQLGCN